MKSNSGADLRKSQFSTLIFTSLFLAVLITGSSSQIAAAGLNAGEVMTVDEGLISRVAPGEFFPVSVKLMNFGAGQRVDVVVNYEILDSNGTVVLAERETVAVETTASFVKNIHIPHGFPSGEYFASSHISYEGQKVPATSNFQFTVERKIAGIFISRLIVYGIITMLVGVAFAIISRLVIRRRFSRLKPHEYSKVPSKERLFYEIVSDVIMQARSHIGNRALETAGTIDGLVINKENGRVLKINKDPAEIVALLMLQYEKLLGKKIKFSSQKLKGATEKSSSVDKNISIIEKYF